MVYIACTVMGQCVYRVNLGLTGRVSGIQMGCGAAGGPKHGSGSV